MIVAAFPDADTLQRAARLLRSAGLAVETRTPIALPEDEHGPSFIPLAMLVVGLGMAAAAFGMQCYAAMVSYRMLIGGRPAFFWTSYLVYAFEVGVVSAIATGLIGFMIGGGLTRLWEPADACDSLRDATRDGWFLVTDGPEARQLLSGLRPLRIEQVPS